VLAGWLFLQSLDVLAEVVAVTLELSCEELLFGFSLDNWDDFVEQVCTLGSCYSTQSCAATAAYEQRC
jgi:hypothetical protein